MGVWGCGGVGGGAGGVGVCGGVWGGWNGPKAVVVAVQTTNPLPCKEAKPKGGRLNNSG